MGTDQGCVAPFHEIRDQGRVGPYGNRDQGCMTPFHEIRDQGCGSFPWDQRSMSCGSFPWDQIYQGHVAPYGNRDQGCVVPFHEIRDQDRVAPYHGNRSRYCRSLSFIGSDQSHVVLSITPEIKVVWLIIYLYIYKSLNKRSRSSCCLRKMTCVFFPWYQRSIFKSGSILSLQQIKQQGHIIVAFMYILSFYSSLFILLN